MIFHEVQSQLLDNTIIKSPFANFDNNEIIEFYDRVSVSMKHNYKLFANFAQYNIKTNLIEGSKSVNFVFKLGAVKANKFSFTPKKEIYKLFDDVRYVAASKNWIIDSERLEINRDNKYLRFTKNVKAKNNDYRVSGEVLNMRFNNKEFKEKNYKELRMFGNVVFINNDIKITSNKLKHMRGSDEVIFTDDVEIYKEEYKIEGDRLIYDIVKKKITVS